MGDRTVCNTMNPRPLSPVITGSNSFFLRTGGCARYRGLTPGYCPAAHYRGLMNSARGARLIRPINNNLEKHADLLEALNCQSSIKKITRPMT